MEVVLIMHDAAQFQSASFPTIYVHMPQNIKSSLVKTLYRATAFLILK